MTVVMCLNPCVHLFETKKNNPIQRELELLDNIVITLSFVQDLDCSPSQMNPSKFLQEMCKVPNSPYFSHLFISFLLNYVTDILIGVK